MHHFVLPKFCLVFPQPTCPIHFFRPKTKFLGCFARFRCREVPVRSCVLFFLNEHAQSSSLGPKLSFWVVSRDSVAGRYSFGKRAFRCIQCMSLCHRNHFFFFRNKHAQSTSLGPKVSFLVVSCDSVGGRYPLRGRVLGCRQCTTFASKVASYFFATNMPNPLL